jgi:hypothetical protein
MKAINKFKSILKYFVFALIAVFTACETTDLDINQNPNELNPSSADPVLVLNGIQIQSVSQSLGLSNSVRDVMRHVNLFGTYANASGQTELDGPWTSTYAIAANTQLLEQLNETSALANHVGIAQTLEALAYVNIVDFIGTAPYSEAINPDISDPSFDAGQDIYNAMYARLDEAIANLNTADQLPLEDLFYNGDLTKWVKLANSLKIKMYVQSKLVNNPNATADINAIIASGQYISSSDDDFKAQFGTNNDNPDVRHPDFAAHYVTGVGNQYMSNEFMNLMRTDKSIEDPRMNYYFYRQTLDAPTGDLLPCDGDPAFTLCYIGDGYWGRMHADNEGIPNDGSFKTTFGIYPAGGGFDNGVNVPTIDGENPNIGGAGIFPMVLSSTVNFWLAEAALPAPAGLGVTGNSRDYLEAAMAESFGTVGAIAPTPINNGLINTYSGEVLANYDGASDSDARLEIIMKEFYISSFGNSIDAYNAYRRTGFPDLGGSVLANTDFPRNFLIPQAELNSNDNPSVVQITRTDQVFWDTNPADFVQ